MLIFKSILMLLLVLGASVAYADDTAAGAAELDLLVAIVTGNIGLTLGLCLAVVGIMQFVKGNMAGAIMFFVLGVIITLLPGIYNGVREISCAVVTSLSAHCGPAS